MKKLILFSLLLCFSGVILGQQYSARSSAIRVNIPNVPKLSFINPVTNNEVTSQKDYNVEVRISGNVAVNVLIINGLQATKNSANVWSATISLVIGENTVTATAYTTQGTLLQETSVIKRVIVIEEVRMALVIGNGNYVGDAKLNNPERDADSVTNALKQLNFEVIKKTNLTQSEMEAAIENFKTTIKNKRAAGKSVYAVFYFSGHGAQIENKNYLLPIGRNFESEAAVKEYAVSGDYIVNLMNESGANVKILMFDACRNNPFGRSWSRGSIDGYTVDFVEPAQKDVNTFISFAASTGQKAQDGVNGRNSPYVKAFLRHIRTPELSISDIFVNITNTVQQETGNSQLPWTSSTLRTPIILKTR